ncbi:zinc ribbon domain-containing protein [Chloroflexota bacterium]
MQRRFFILLVLGLLFLVPAARAQGPVDLAGLEVDLWPEYDRSDVLVIYKAKLPANVSLPVDVMFKIPVDAGEPYAVAVRQMDGSLLNAAYERQVEGNWALITITATMPDIQLEYYDPQIEIAGEERSYTYVWPGDYDVEAMRIVIQQPVGARQMSVEPNLGSFTQIEGDPMQYYVMDVGSPKSGETVSVDLSYIKDTNTLSVESLQVHPTGPINGNDGGRQSGFLTFLPWLIGGLGVLLLIGGGVWYWQMNKTETQPAASKRSRKTKTPIKSPEQISAENGSQGVFCHQCGKRAATGDRFCRSCGAKLRK